VTIVFLDRDGVINENRSDDYVKSWEDFVFLPNAKEALRRLAGKDEVKIFVVSNQAGIGKDLVTVAQVDEVNRRMKDEIETAGGRIDGIFYCPHSPEEGCSCRKPEAELLLKVLEETPGNPHRRFMVGDAISDMAAAKKVSAVAIMVRTGRGKEQLNSVSAGSLKVDYIAEDVSEAVEIILQNIGQ